MPISLRNVFLRLHVASKSGPAVLKGDAKKKKKTAEDGDGNVGKTIRLIAQDKKRR